MKVLITGANGFLGKNMLNACQAFNVPAIGHSRQDGDLCDPVHVKEFLDQVQPTHIWHFAADPTSKLNITNFSKAIQNNILATQNLAHYTPHGCTFLFASSVLVYGETRSQQHTKSVTKPISIYGAGKLACENIVRIYSKTNSFNYTNFRLCAAVGPNMTHGLLPDLIRKCKSDDPVLELFGNKPGSSKPFIHTEDVFSCFMKYTNYSNTYDTINLSGNGIVNVRRIASIIQKKLGTRKKIQWNPSAVWFGDNRKLLIRQSWSIRQDMKFDSVTAIRKAIDENI